MDHAPARDTPIGSVRTVAVGGSPEMIERSSDGRTDEDALIEKWIEPDPNRPGAAHYWLKGYGVHVWALVGHFKGVGDVATVAKDYDVPVESVEAVLAYYKRHKAVIDDRIAWNAW
jgi:uncharacterized protein (DUF433 family)